MLEGVKLSTFTTAGQVPTHKDSFSGVSCTDYYLQTGIAVEMHVDCIAIYASNVRTRRRFVVTVCHLVTIYGTM
jgi:hypothetical protein